jgi:hypothetical protein
MSGQAIVIYMVRNPIWSQFASQSASALNLGSSSIVLNAFGSFAGGSITSVVFAYAGYMAGLHDLPTANRSIVAGIAGAAAGPAFYVGTLALVGTFGTASTGTAISTLSGAAATKASLALLGGGSLATGGGGVAAGTLVLSGGVAIVVVAVPVAVMYGFQLYDARQETIRIGKAIEYLKQKKDFSVNVEWRGRAVESLE